MSPAAKGALAGVALSAVIAIILAANVAGHEARHPEPDSAVMEPAADGSHWVTPAGTRVYTLATAGAVCFVAEASWAGNAGHGNVPPAISCLPAEAAP